MLQSNGLKIKLKANRKSKRTALKEARTVSLPLPAQDAARKRKHKRKLQRAARRNERN